MNRDWLPRFPIFRIVKIIILTLKRDSRETPQCNQISVAIVIVYHLLNLKTVQVILISLKKEN